MPTDQETSDQEQQHEKRPGAPLGSANAIKHGCRGLRDSIRYGLTAFALPDGCHHIESKVNTFRERLENAVQAARGTVSAVDGITINRAARWEAFARLAARWLSHENDKLTPEQKQSFARDVMKGTTERDRAVADLDLSSNRLASLWTLNNGQGDA